MCNPALDYALACEPISDEECFRRYGYPVECEGCAPEPETPPEEGWDYRATLSDLECLDLDLHLIAVFFNGSSQQERDGAGEEREERTQRYRDGARRNVWLDFDPGYA